MMSEDSALNLQETAAMKHPTRHCLQLWTIILCSFGLSVTNFVGTAVAQNGTMSHRRLELPRNSPTQPQEQLARLLQYIQSLKGESPTPKPKNSTESDDPTLSELKKALGPELSGMLDKLPPNTVNDAMQDPAIRSQVKDMLQQFSKDGTLPDFNDRSNQNSPAQNRSQPGSETRKPNQSKTEDGRNQRRREQNSPQRNPPTTSPPNLQPPAESKRNPEDRLRDLIEQLRQRKSPPANSGNPTAQQPGRPSADDTGSNQSSDTRSPADPSDSQSGNSILRPPMTESQWEERLRELMQKQRDSVRNRKENQTPNNAQPERAGNSQSPGGRQSPNQNSFESIQSGAGNASPKRPEPKRPRSTNSTESLSSGNGDRQPNDLSQSFNESQGASKPAPSMSEFLEQMRGAPTPDLRDLGVDLSATQQGSQGKMSGNLFADALKQMDPQQLREQAKKALQDKGLRNTLKDILKDAKQSAKQEGAAGGGPGDLIANVAAATGMEDTVLEALGGMTEELVEIAKDAKFQSPTSGSATESQPSDGSTANNPASNTNETSKSPKEKSVFSQFTESASNAINNFSQAPQASASSSATSDILPDLGSGSLSTLVFVLLVIIGLIGCLFVGTRLMPVAKPETSEQILATLLKQGIRTKEDVIKAFHQFALRPPHETQHWWTHSRVIEKVAHQYPQHSARIQILAALYEQARYFPADTEFTDAQIQQAADAVRTVGVA